MATADEPPRIAGPVPQPKRPRQLPPPGAWDSHFHIFGPSDRFSYQPGRAYTPPDAPVGRLIALLDHLGFSNGLVVQGNAHVYDNRVVLDLDVSDDSVGAQVSSATGGSVPSIDTRQIVTQVLVNDGQTVVLGGILDTTKTKSANKVPWLGDIPVLGNLFKSTTNVNNKTELLIFITPKILREGTNLY